MSTPSARLAELGLSLPPVAAPLAAYVPATVSSGHVYTSGQLPSVAGELTHRGQVGAEVSLEDAVQAARTAMLNALAAAASVIGGLDRIGRVIKVTVFVASDPTFTGQPAVANGASRLLIDVFGPEIGCPARSAIGVNVLPGNISVEVELMVQIAQA